MMVLAPVRNRPTLTPDRIEWHLWNWEQYMHRPTREGHAPGTASGWDCRTYDNDSDRGYEYACILAAEAVQAIIDGLPQRLRLAIHFAHGIVSDLYRQRDQGEAYAEACVVVGVQLASRAMC